MVDNLVESLSLTHFEAMKMNCRCDTSKYIVDNFYMHQRTFHNVHWWCRIMIIYFNNTRFSSFSKNTSQQESTRSFYRYKLYRIILAVDSWPGWIEKSSFVFIVKSVFGQIWTTILVNINWKPTRAIRMTSKIAHTAHRISVVQF